MIVFNDASFSIEYLSKKSRTVTIPYETWQLIVNTIRVVQDSVLLKQDSLSDSTINVAKLDEIVVKTM